MGLGVQTHVALTDDERDDLGRDLTNLTTTRKAIERAADSLDPVLGKERLAELLANMVWALANLQFQPLSEALANGLDIETEPYVEVEFSDGGPPTERYNLDEEGDAESPDDEKCQSIAQRVDELAARLEDVQAQIKRINIGTEVERYLAVKRERAEKAAKEPQQA
jgi:hypothetical protein